MAALYKFINDEYTDDLTYLDLRVPVTGRTPTSICLRENITSHLVADDYWGISSHDVFFRTGSGAGN